ncbi:MAG: immunoglobulin domain-containing protein [Bdellovibrionales bacterium]|nr:immunoglobulin domain-containing protein [Bdellovibrionales bacterium]
MKRDYVYLRKEKVMCLSNTWLAHRPNSTARCYSLFVLFSVLLLVAHDAFATPDVSIVPARGRTAWHVAGVHGGIPADASDPTIHPAGFGPATVFTTLSPSGGDDTNAIRNALSAAGSVATKTDRKIVLLGPGTFLTSAYIGVPSYVTLRGTTGPNNAPQTIVRETSNRGSMFGIFGGANASWRPVYQVVGIVPQGATTLQVTDASGIQVGDVMIIDQVNDGPGNGPADGVFDCNHQTPTNRCHARNSSLFYSRGPYTYPDGSGTGLNMFGPESTIRRNTKQAVEILARNGNTLTVYDPTNHPGLGSPVHQAFYNQVEMFHAGGTLPVARGAGIENLMLHPRGLNGHRVVAIDRAVDSWVKNVGIDGEVQPWSGRHMHVWANAAHITISGCYVRRSGNYFQGANAYGYVNQGSNILFENNIAIDLNKPFVGENSGPGTVWANNYADNAVIDRNDNTPENHFDNNFQEAAMSTHGSFVQNNLWEGNHSPNFTIDSTHGNNGWNTLFKNYATGSNSNGYASAYRRAISVDGWNHAQYSIGNVLWQPGLNVDYLLLEPSLGINVLAGGPEMIYMLGANYFELVTGANRGAEAFDNGYAFSQFHRHLDYDGFTRSQYTNPSNPVTNLPNSLYAMRKPSYFGVYEWPWINPAGATHADRVKINPAKARYDAGTPFALAPGAGLPSDLINPTVAITNPSNGQSVVGTVSIAVTATDNADVALVRFLVDGNPLSVDFTAPYTGQWDSTLLANGNHTLTVVAEDTSANSATASINVTVNNPVIAPSITSQPVGQTVSVGGRATFSVAVAGTPNFNYQWQRNGSNIPGATAQSYSITSTTLADDSTNYRVRVSNSAGSAFSATANLTVTEGPAAQASYNFDEGSGNVLADSSGNRNGTVNGATWTTGRHNGGLSFDGVNDGVALGNWNVTGSAITLSAWVNSPDWNANADVRIISKASGTAEQAHTFMLSERGGQPRVRLKTNGNTQTLVGSSTLPTNTWVHIAAVYNGSTLTLYQDGAQVGSLGQGGNIAQNNEQITLGMNPDNTNHFQGRMDDVRIYNVALIQAEVQASMSIPVGEVTGGGDTQRPLPPTGLRLSGGAS